MTVPVSTTSTKPPPPDIHAIDFANTTLPAGSCKAGGWINPLPIPVVAGEGSSGSDADGTYAQVNVEDPPQFVDLDGDGFDEAVFWVLCGAGGTAAERFVLPLTTGSGTLSLLGGQNLPSLSTVVEGTPESRFASLRLDGTTVVVDEVVQVGDEARCCFTGEQTVFWRFANGSWSHELQGGAPPPAPTELQANGLSTDGVAPLVFGDPLSRAIELTGKQPTDRCGPGSGQSVIKDALPGLNLMFSGGVFVEYGTLDSRYSTPSGGRVGMTISALQEAIPYAKREPGPYDEVIAVHSGENVLMFTDDGSVVTQINAGRDGSTGFGC